MPLPPPPEPPPPPAQPPGSPPPSPLPPLPHATDLCYNCTLVCVAPYAELGSLSTTLPASVRFQFGYGEEAVAAEVSPEGEAGAAEGASPPRYLSPLSQHERDVLAPRDAPIDEFGDSFALIRVAAVSASTEEPSGGRGAAHIADGSGLRHYVEGAAYDGTPPALYHPMPPPARRPARAAHISSPRPAMARLHAPAYSPPASLPLYPPAPSPLHPPSATPHTAPTHTHMRTCARLLAGRFVGGRYTPLPGGPGGAGDDAPSRPGTTVNSFCDAPHGLECGGLCWGSDVRVHSALHSALHKDALHNAMHVHHAYHMGAASLPRALRRRLPASLAPYAKRCLAQSEELRMPSHPCLSLDLAHSRELAHTRPCFPRTPRPPPPSAHVD